jgi:hypothetical protein
MGWLDYHLHEFRSLNAKQKQERRPSDAPPATCADDFGDVGQHVVVQEGMESAEEALSYPRCIGGARRYPPEDCGGVGLSCLRQCIRRLLSARPRRCRSSNQSGPPRAAPGLAERLVCALMNR